MLFGCLVREAGRADQCAVRVSGALEALAHACSPRVEPHGDDAVVFDVSGLSRVLGSPSVMAAEVSRLSTAQGLATRMAVAGTMTAAWLLAHAHAGITVVPPGEEAAALSALPLRSLQSLPDSGTRHFTPGTRPLALGTRRSRASLKPSAECLVPESACLQVLARWGLRTLGDLARLPLADVRTRLGEAGVRLHQAARGKDAMPLVPAGASPRFAERLDLEWPIEGLEPLSFVLARLCEALSATLERADRGAVTVTTRLRLVTRTTHERVLNLPAPMREARVLRTLILLDLESHPPVAAIDVVEIEAGVTPGRIVQGSLLVRTVPSPEALATLVARLSALVGESRVGAPVVGDTYDERAVTMRTFRVTDQGRRHKAQGISEVGPPARSALLPSACCLLPCFRRFRLPLPARVTVERGAPIRVVSSASGCSGGSVVASAGPWRTSGRWWALDRMAWDRDEWDVELPDGVYRIARDRTTGQWEIEGSFD